MATITNNIRWASNTEELKKNLLDGVNTLDAMKQAVDRTANSMSGTGLFGQANKVAAAIQQLGTVTKLTAAEQERYAATLDKAIEKYKVMGIEAPKAILDIRNQLTRTTEASQDLNTQMVALGSATGAFLGTLGGNLAVNAIASLVGGLHAIAVAIPEIALRGAGIADVEENFQHLTAQVGLLGTALMGTLRSGTHNTIDDFELMKTVNKDLAAGLNLTDRQFGTLAKGAFALAQATGVDVKSALDTMNDAMLTGRTRALALLTGKIDTTKAEEEFAKSLHTTADKLSEEGKLEAARVAILKSVGEATERLGEQTDGLDERVAQAQVAWQNFQDNLGKTIAASPVLAEGMNGIARALGAAFGDTQQNLVTSVARVIDSLAIGVIDLAKLTVQAGIVMSEQWANVRAQLMLVAEALLAARNPGQLPELISAAKAIGDEWARTRIKIAESGSTIISSLDETRSRMVAARDASKGVAEATRDVGAAQDSTGQSLRSTTDYIKDATEKTKKHKYEMVGLGEAGEKFVEEYEGRVNKALAQYYERLEQIIPAQKDWWNLLANPPKLPLPGIQIGNDAAFAEQNKTTSDALARQLGSVIGLMPDLGKKAGEEFNSGFGDSLSKLAGIFSRAFEGGGGIAGALKSAGVQIADQVLSPLFKKLSEFSAKAGQAVSVGVSAATAFGGAFGGGAGAAIGGIASSVAGLALAHTALASSTVALGAATMGIGAAAVGVYLLAKHWLSVTQAEKDARKAFDDFNKGIGGSNVNDFIARVSQAGAVLEMDGERVRQLIQKVLDATHKSPQALAEALAPLVDLIDAADKKTADLANGVDAITEAFQKAGGRIPASLRASLESLVKMKGLTDDQRKALQGLLDQSATNFQALTDKAAGFGITIDALGPKFQQVQIEARSKDIADFLQDATEAGGDVGGMLAGLSDEISQLVNDSIKFGTAIPDNMKPYIDELIRAHKLTDENGKAIDDITGISFEATPLDKGLDGLTKAIEDLIKLLTDGVTGALDKVGNTHPDPIHIPVEWDVPELPRFNNPDGAATGGLVTAFGIQRFAMGGFAGMGTDTVPAMLTPGESVLNVEATKRLGVDQVRSLNRGGDVGGGPLYVIPVIVDGNSSPETQASKIINVIKDAAVRNRQGFRSALVEALS